MSSSSPIHSTSAIEIHKLSKVFKHQNTEIKALHDLNLEIEQGCCLGIMGRNGSGKSTLLRILAGLTKPSNGHAQIRGRVASVLEMGLGFHPDLSGRANLELALRLMGCPSALIEEQKRRIIKFSELNDELDRPVKQYSQGMFLRLSFSLATEVDADILLFDECLSVGDVSFQQKCNARLEDLKASGRTILVVSHDAHQVLRCADKYMVLEGGRVAALSSDARVLDQYLRLSSRMDHNRGIYAEAHRLEQLRVAHGIVIDRISAGNAYSSAPRSSEEQFYIETEVRCPQEAGIPRMVFHLHDVYGYMLATYSSLEVAAQPSSLLLYRCTTPGAALNAGSYLLSLYLIGSDGRLLFHLPYVYSFHIEQSASVKAPLKQNFYGPFRLKSKWSLRSSTQSSVYVSNH